MANISPTANISLKLYILFFNISDADEKEVSRLPRISFYRLSEEQACFKVP